MVKCSAQFPCHPPCPRNATDGTTGAIGNEPHHIGVSADGKTFVTGGLLSVLRGQDQTFFFDVTRPRSPQFITANNPGYDPKTGAPSASIADEFEPLSNGGFLASFMGGPNGAAPGRVVEYDANHHYVNAWPTDLPESGFNPHGIAVDEVHNLIVTSDFICPLHTLYYTGNHPNAEFRGSVRVWDFKNRAIKKTIIIGDPAQPAGTINIQLIPNDPQLRAFTDGVYDGKLYLVDTENGTAKPVFNFTTDPRFINAGGAPVWPHLFRISKDAHYLYITLNYLGKAGKVVAFDITDPDDPKVTGIVDLGPNSGPHYLHLSKDEKRLVVSDYFLNEDLVPPGVVAVEGDHKIHVIKVDEGKLELDTRFDLDFNSAFSTGPARPHGLTLLSSKGDNANSDGS